MAVIGGMLCSEAAFDRARRQLRPTDFVDLATRAVFETCLELKAVGEATDATVVLRHCRSLDAFRDGKCAYFLAQCGELGFGDGLQQHYIDKLREASMFRQLSEVGDLMACALEDRRAPTSILAEVGAAVADLQNDRTEGDTSATALFAEYARGVCEREAPPLIHHAREESNLERLEIGLGDVLVLGAPPGRGKTTLVNAIAFNALTFAGQEDLRVSFCNVEMSPQAIFDKELSRRTGIGYSYLRHRDYAPEAAPRISAGLSALAKIMPRVSIMRGPFTLDRTIEHVRQHSADLVVLDYLQRFTVEGEADQRGQIDKAMDTARQMASEGRAVIVVSAVSRGQNSRGLAYAAESMGLHSFRNSSELEYGADNAWLFLREPDSREVTLKQVKSRFGSNDEIALEFDGDTQAFRDAPVGQEWGSK